MVRIGKGTALNQTRDAKDFSLTPLGPLLPEIRMDLLFNRQRFFGSFCQFFLQSGLPSPRGKKNAYLFEQSQEQFPQSQFN